MEATAVLVLSRKRSQTIVLPTLGITIDLLEIRGNRVRIGIDAPAEVPIYRQEVAQRLESPAADAVNGAGDGHDEVAVAIDRGAAGLVA
jgi:carbon storage regulator